MEMEVIKSTGERESFSKDKLCQSIKSAGAPHELAVKVCALAVNDLRAGATTSKIFRSALRYLLKEDLGLAANYSLRRGVGDLGPAGFLFEHYVEIILQAYGYKTVRNIMAKGFCVEHEIDVVAKMDGVKYYVEAKYRNERGIKTHIDVVMYGDARLADIAKASEKKGEEEAKLWLITNTKFTSKAVKYAKCRGIKMTGWTYPNGDNLESMIIKRKLYPITVLPSVKRYEREQFAKFGLLLAQDILPYSPEELAGKFNLDFKIAKKIINQSKEIVR